MEWTQSCYIFYLPKINIFHFAHHGAKLYHKYIKSDDRKKYIDDDGSGIFPKQKVENIYNEKYQTTYYNQNYVLDRY